ncbi:MAG: large repetitive protein, partial [Euryarchaeota archaeon]|nr:large repetitive protein [Euryarchaeota archaeon]
MRFSDIIEHRYRHIFLVIVIAGLLLAISASAQMGLSPDVMGQEGIIPTEGTGGANDNQQPVIDSVDSNKESPQEAGSSIKWTAKATDPEGDSVLFQFRLKGPSTGDAWSIVAPWSEENAWKWDTDSQEAGEYQISVWVKDESHPDDQFTPNEKIALFTLTAPQSAHIDQQPPVKEQEALPQNVEPINQAPVLTGLTSSPASPQEAGAAIAWTAEASDQEEDGLQFQFL